MKRKQKSSSGQSSGSGNGSGQGPEGENLPTGPTGRYIVILRHGSQKSLAKALNDTAGIRAASTADFEGAAVNDEALSGSDGLLLEHLDLAVVEGDSDQIKSLEMAIADESNPVLSIEPEVYVSHCDYMTEDEESAPAEGLLTAAGREYFLGYQDAIRALGARLLSTQGGAAAVAAATSYVDTDTLTWGLQATKAGASRCTGRGIRVAVLDTGMDLNHPDFAGRNIVSASFVPGQAVQDGHSHGTHCIGTACGPKSPTGTQRRYGIAGESTILVGKVLSNQGSGQTGWILAGINWAIQQKAVVISMSLGSAVPVGGTFSPAYEQAAVSALANNCLIVAAAGNSGNQPVGSPANCPSIVAVGSLDQDLKRSSFSCIAMNGNGGELNIAAPGRNVFSSVPMPTRYGTKSGTSMATPHVAGIAALLAQNTGLRGMALWQKLTATAINISQPAAHVGAGLAKAPSCSRPSLPYPLPQLPPFPRLPFPPRSPFDS